MRLIDADALVERIIERIKSYNWSDIDEIVEIVIKQTFEDVRNQPTVDAIPVVRCKDCKHYEKQGKRLGHCSRIHNYCTDDGWCLDGEREENV